MLQDKYDHGFAVDLMKKDLDIVINKANDSDINVEITKLINDFYKGMLFADKWTNSRKL